MESAQFVPKGGRSRLAASVALHGDVFKTDPLMRALFRAIPPSEMEGYLSRFVGCQLRAAGLHGARIDEVYTQAHPASPTTPPACSAIWLGPESTSPGTLSMLRAGLLPLLWKLGIKGLRDVFAFKDQYAKEMEAFVDESGRPVKKYWELFHFATHSEEQGKGFGAKVIRDFQKDCTLPIFLQSSSEGSRRLYARCGFVEIGSFVVGEGEAGADGWRKPGGEGARTWGMVWWPDRKNEQVSDVLAPKLPKLP